MTPRPCSPPSSTGYAALFIERDRRGTAPISLNVSMKALVGNNAQLHAFQFRNRIHRRLGIHAARCEMRSHPMIVQPVRLRRISARLAPTPPSSALAMCA